MYLFIDNTNKDRLLIKYYLVGGGWSTVEHKVGRDSVLLFYIDKLLKKYHLDKNDIKGIGVLLSDGGFTSVRISTVLVNVLHLSKKIPAIGLNTFLGLEDLDLKKVFKMNGRKYVMPKYNGEPNIGIKKD